MPEVSFHNITVKVPNVTGFKRHLPSFFLKNSPQKEILHNVSGTLPKKGLVAVMGPSGSSKTTLLNTISNRMSMAGSNGLQAFGEVHVDGINVAPDYFFSKKVSFVPQETCLFAELTPRESITYASKFTYPHWSEKQITSHVNNIISALNITKCADSQIGNEIFRGISGGEAKRTSIGVNIVNSPEILILDEPTTGLDSETATIVVRSILNLSAPLEQEKKLLDKQDHLKKPHQDTKTNMISSKNNNNNNKDDDGRLIIMTLHQPSSEVWDMIDHVILMAEGHIVYNGKTTEIIPYFASLGFHLPPNTNPADFLLDVVQMAEDDYSKVQKIPRRRNSQSSQPSLSSQNSQNPSTVTLDSISGSQSSISANSTASQQQRRLASAITLSVANNANARAQSLNSLPSQPHAAPEGVMAQNGPANTRRVQSTQSLQSTGTIGMVNGKEQIVRAAKHANKFERARYLSHAWNCYQEEMKSNFNSDDDAVFTLQGTGYRRNSSTTGGSMVDVTEDANVINKRERLRKMMVKYHQEHGHLYRLSNTDQDDNNRRGTSLYDQDDAMDTYNYDDVSSPLRFTSSNRQHSNNNISTNGLDAHHDHQPGSTFRDVEGNPHNPRSAKNSALQHDLTPLQVFFRQLRTLTSRSWITFIRTKMMLPLKVGQVILSAIIVIALYYQFEYNQQSVLQRSSCMYLLIIIQIFATVLSVALTFPNERGVFMNEQSSRSYSVIPYFISKLLIDVPILTICIFMFSIITYFPIKLTLAFDRFIIYCLVLESVSLIGHGLGLIVASVVPSPSMAVLFAPMTIAPFILFSHIAIPSGYVLPFLRPLMWLSPFYWGLDALMINEFKGIRLGCTDEELYAVPSVAQGLVYICRFETAKDALDSYSIKLDMLWPSIFALYGISAGLICIAGGILWYLSKSISSAVKLRPATHH